MYDEPVENQLAVLRGEDGKCIYAEYPPVLPNYRIAPDGAERIIECLALEGIAHLVQRVLRSANRSLGISLRPTCIALDFDNTVAHFVGGREQLFSVFTSHGFEEAHVVTAYEGGKESGFNFVELIRRLHAVDALRVERLTAQALMRECDAWLARSLVVYPDSLEAITNWRTQGIPTVIVTCGDEVFQNRKVESVRVPHDGVFCCSTDEGKVTVLRRLVEKYGSPILFVDDKAAVLDFIREGCFRNGDAFASLSGVVRIRIDRGDSPYRARLASYQHDRDVTTLNQLGAMVVIS